MQFSELVDKYGDEKAELDALDKLVKADNKELKRLMSAEIKKDNYKTEKYKVTYKLVKTENFDNEKLVARLHHIWGETHGSMTCPYTKITYVPNMEEIEKAIYSGELDAKDLADCKTVKEQERLTVTAIDKN